MTPDLVDLMESAHLRELQYRAFIAPRGLKSPRSTELKQARTEHLRHELDRAAEHRVAR